MTTLQKLSEVTEEERQVIKELYSARAVPEHKISGVLKKEFGMTLSPQQIQHIIFRFPAEVRNKRKAVQKERRAKVMARIWAKEREEGKRNVRGIRKWANPEFVDYIPDVHGIPLWHGNPRHNQNVVKKCTVCGCLFHPYSGWEKDEVYCSFSCQAKD